MDFQITLFPNKTIFIKIVWFEFSNYTISKSHCSVIWILQCIQITLLWKATWCISDITLSTRVIWNSHFISFLVRVFLETISHSSFALVGYGIQKHSHQRWARDHRWYSITGDTRWFLWYSSLSSTCHWPILRICLVIVTIIEVFGFEISPLSL